MVDSVSPLATMEPSQAENLNRAWRKAGGIRRAYEDVSVGTAECADRLGAPEWSRLGATAQVWRHVAHCFVWGTSVFQRQSGARPGSAGVLHLEQYLQLPADPHA